MWVFIYRLNFMRFIWDENWVFQAAIMDFSDLRLGRKYRFGRDRAGD